MELRDFAERILLSTSLDEKLLLVREPFTDLKAGIAKRIELPGRPAKLVFADRRKAPPMPHPLAFEDVAKRGVAHHIMANHELQALEVMAWMLLAFPEAPAEYRFGLAEVMQDEQRHTRMHVERAHAHGVEFGDYPVNSYIWKKALEFRSLLEYLASLPLTFEGRNLDHSLEFEAVFRTVDDVKSAAVMRQIHRDEIHHVAFGMTWLRHMKPAHLSDWECYKQSLKWPLRPEKSIGDTFQLAARRQAGMDDAFLAELQQIAARDGIPICES